MRVITTYGRDGRYDVHSAPDSISIYVRMSDKKYDAYKRHMERDAEWQAYLRELDNEYVAKCDEEVDK